jgi:hypothetical protein
MQQPQKAIPAAAPFRKFLRVGVIEIRPSVSSEPVELHRRPVLAFFARHIAKPEAEGQSSRQGLSQATPGKSICFGRIFACVCFVH